MKMRTFIWCVIITFSLMNNVAHAARSFTYAQSPATALAVFNMGSTQTLSYQITNTSTGANVGERIYSMQFNLPGTGTVFSASTSAPAGWTRSAFSATSVTFLASSWNNAIAVSGNGPTTTASFSLVLVMASASTDVNDSLKSIRANFTKSTSPPFKRSGFITTNTSNLWKLKSLAITSLQITDTLGNPVTALAAGSSFRLVMTVINNSSASQSGIVSNPNPPTPVKTGTVTQALTGTAGSPLTLASGASGTITFTYSTAATDNGTIYFTANAQSGASVTSSLTTSSTLALSKFTAAITPSVSCQYAGSTITVTMALTNGFPYSILNVTPTLTQQAGAPLTYVSGPTPATIASIGAGAGTNVSWVYQVNNNIVATDPFNFSGSATGTGNTVGSPIITTPLTPSASIARGEFLIVVNPSATNTSSANVELTWSVTNNGCLAVNSVGISVPAGWVWANDAYSLVNLSAVSAIETWVASGANPVTFTSPNPASQLPQIFSGDFSLVFSATPAAVATSVFTVTAIDAGAAVVAIPVNVTVNPFMTGVLNNATNNTWREDFH